MHDIHASMVDRALRLLREGLGHKLVSPLTNIPPGAEESLLDKMNKWRDDHERPQLRPNPTDWAPDTILSTIVNNFRTFGPIFSNFSTDELRRAPFIVIGWLNDLLRLRAKSQHQLEFVETDCDDLLRIAERLLIAANSLETAKSVSDLRRQLLRQLGESLFWLASSAEQPSQDRDEDVTDSKTATESDEDEYWEEERIQRSENTNISRYMSMPVFIVCKESGKCIDVPWEEKIRWVHQINRYGGENQQWELRALPDGSIVIFSVGRGMCLEIAGGRREHQPDAWLQVGSYSGQDHQKFVFKELEDGSFAIHAKHSNLVVDVETLDERSRMHQWPWHGGENQRWYLKPAFSKLSTLQERIYENVPVMITNKQTDMSLDKPWGMEAGRIYVHSPHGKDNQRWFLKKAPDGSVAVFCGDRHKCLEIQDGSPEENAWLHVGAFEGKDSQYFFFDRLSDGSYKIRPKHVARRSNFVLDAVEPRAEAHVYQHPWHGRDNQRWWLHPAFKELSEDGLF